MGAHPGATHLPPRGRVLAPDAAVGNEERSQLHPKRVHIVALFTAPPAGATVLCVDELGPVTPRNVLPTPGWSMVGHRINNPLDYERGADKVWVYGALCLHKRLALTETAPSRNTTGYLALLQALYQSYPHDSLDLVADNLTSHRSTLICDWLAAYPHSQHAFIPVGAAWLNLIEGWCRLFRRKAFAGASLAQAEKIAYATCIASSVAVVCTTFEEQRTRAWYEPY